MILTFENFVYMWVLGVGIAALRTIIWRGTLPYNSKFDLLLGVLCFLWPFTLIAYIIYNWMEKHKKEKPEDDTSEEKTHKIKPCQDRIFYGIDCLENETQLGFFKSDADRRPSSCTWIDKDVAEKLYKLFKYGETKQ